MTEKKIRELLESTGITTGRGHFTTPKKLPYMVYMVSDSPPVASDYETVGRMPHYRVEFYATRKDEKAERKIEQALEGAGVVLEKYEVEIPEQRMIETIYEFDTLEVK
ncbi:hypothetical protein RWV98_02965 [Agathobaculum sp. NTUH-O15-33]|uniref:hypothetical protein n=1 Tax=Agathobaculum sp. NTUH-O15-33 TaxID=3079302 RepID=UPI00295882AF|nr:hypothetical protein [Agathobaculum sp. NTUH-O15-33]WNX85253.1 hypothetical protein RWV98_02965 [Agathobaculum sp. NTUH-O15-33]